MILLLCGGNLNNPCACVVIVKYLPIFLLELQVAEMYNAQKLNHQTNQDESEEDWWNNFTHVSSRKWRSAARTPSQAGKNFHVQNMSELHH